MKYLILAVLLASCILAIKPPVNCSVVVMATSEFPAKLTPTNIVGTCFCSTERMRGIDSFPMCQINLKDGAE